MDSNKPKATHLNQDNFFDLRNLFELFMTYWKWFILSIFLCGGATYFYVSTLSSSYQRNAVLLVKDENSMSADKLVTMMDPTGTSKSTSIENELYTLTSIEIISEVVKRLHLDVNYTQKQGLKTASLFNEVPFEIHFLGTYDGPVQFDVVAYDQSGITLSNLNKEKGETLTIAYNDTVQSPIGALVVTPRVTTVSLSTENPIHVSRLDKETSTDIVKSRITTSPVAKQGTLVKISCIDENIARADAVLNTLMKVYTETIIADKNKVASNTARFIDERILVISDELGDVENKLTQFKQENGIVDIQSKATTSLAEGSAAKAQSVELSAQLNVANFVRNFVTDASKRNELIPNVSGIGDAGVEGQIQMYNELLLRCNRLTENSGEQNSVVLEMNRQLAAMRSSISGSLNTYCSTLSLRIRDAQKQENNARQSISSIPLQEKKVLDVMRQQKIKETLYTFLLQTREETAMQLAATEAGLRVVEAPHGSRVPVGPNKMQLLMFAIAAGFVLPFGILFLRQAMQTGVRGKKDIQQYTTIPILGTIPSRKEAKREADIVVSAEKNDYITEAFRLLRTNLSFFQRDAKVLMFTSTVAHEGKTFVSRNFAITMALLGKRVILVDTDIRKGKQGKLLRVNKKEGLSTYLSGHSENLDDLILKNVLGDCVDFLPSGIIPPNPSELLMSHRLEELTEQLRKEYDYIIIDNVPAMVVADASIVNRVADATLYVIRDGLIDRRFLPELEQLYQDKKFKHMSIILNDVKEVKGSYGYGYGYGYGYYSGDNARRVTSRTSFLKRIFGGK